METTPGLGLIIQLGSFGLLSLVVLWAVKWGVPAILKHMEDMAMIFSQALDTSRAEVERSREYHREDKAAMRDFMGQELAMHRDSVAGLARAIERNTVAQIAASKGEDAEAAVARFTNGG